jgi:uncharacterized alkaline shock family protein YloU
MTPPGDPGTPAGSPGDVDLSPARVGSNELGRITVGARAVEKIAALAAVEIPDAGGAAARLLGRAVPGAGRMGIRGSGLNSLPKVTADVDGELGFLDVELSIRWPAPISDVTEQVRRHLFARLAELVGLEVREVNIDVVDLITEAPSARVS